jgi:hypothetical protein
MAKKSADDTYTGEEAKNRLVAELRGARLAGAMPMKEVARKKADQPQANLKKVKSRRARVAVAKAKKGSPPNEGVPAGAHCSGRAGVGGLFPMVDPVARPAGSCPVGSNPANASSPPATTAAR